MIRGRILASLAWWVFQMQIINPIFVDPVLDDYIVILLIAAAGGIGSSLLLDFFVIVLGRKSR